MKKISEDKLASLEFQLKWKSSTARHTDIYYASHVNFWRDIFPGDVRGSVMGKGGGDEVAFSFEPGEVVQAREASKIFVLNGGQFDRHPIKGRTIEPRFGRFYPKGLLKEMPNIFKGNIEPFRCVGIETAGLDVDFNHPLAGKALALNVAVRDIIEKPGDRGGRITDWMETVADGPGMQARVNGRPTDFFLDAPFTRSDEHEDPLFYVKPRLVTHIDDRAREIIAGLYGTLLKPGMRVLDLMSSWRSHIPDSLQLESLVGLGLNKEEMADNPRLTGHVIHDLNAEPRLPFEDGAFDAVICTVSVEYMIRPFDVFEDVARILKPGGLFVHTFSNRWFPPKVVRIWSELNEFERMGLVLEYFSASGSFGALETRSYRGWPRPATDRYFPEMMTADPVYAVQGRTKA